jgi:hypothetical protein
MPRPLQLNCLNFLLLWRPVPMDDIYRKFRAEDRPMDKVRWDCEDRRGEAHFSKLEYYGYVKRLRRGPIKQLGGCRFSRSAAGSAPGRRNATVETGPLNKI